MLMLLPVYIYGSLLGAGAWDVNLADNTDPYFFSTLGTEWNIKLTMPPTPSPTPQPPRSCNSSADCSGEYQGSCNIISQVCEAHLHPTPHYTHLTTHHHSHPTSSLRSAKFSAT
jgi:hypothetical protein